MSLFFPFLFLFVAATVQATTPTILYSTSFEATEGYMLNAPLIGQPGSSTNRWTGVGSGGSGVVTNFLPNQVQSAFIGFSTGTNQDGYLGVGQKLNYRPLDQRLPLITFSTQIKLYASTTNLQDAFDFTVYNIEGVRLFSLRFPTGEGSQPISYFPTRARIISPPGTPTATSLHIRSPWSWISCTTVGAPAWMP